MPRSLWKGAIAFGLVNVPGRALSRRKSARDSSSRCWTSATSRRSATSATTRRRGKEVEWADIVKGYEYEKDQYVVLSDEDFRRANVKASRTIEIQAFVPRRRDPAASTTRPPTTSRRMPAARRSTRCCARRCATTGRVAVARARDPHGAASRRRRSRRARADADHAALRRRAPRRERLRASRGKPEERGSRRQGARSRQAPGRRHGRALESRRIQGHVSRGPDARGSSEKIKQGADQGDHASPNAARRGAPRSAKVIDLAALLKQSLDAGRRRAARLAPRRAEVRRREAQAAPRRLVARPRRARPVEAQAGVIAEAFDAARALPRETRFPGDAGAARPCGAARRRRAHASSSRSMRASQLHYDFRLEHDGVLLSWAVPKGPSLDPQDKRLAMHVEDHPLEYGDFEGIIPPGPVRIGGTVMVWDRGTWEPIGDPAAGYRKGHLKFTLDGEKLKGALGVDPHARQQVRRQGRRQGVAADQGEGRLRQARTRRAHRRRRSPTAWSPAAASRPSPATRRTNGIRTGRSRRICAPARSAPPCTAPRRPALRRRQPRRPRKRVEAARQRRRRHDPGVGRRRQKARMPAMLSPALATLVRAAPTGDDWLHEVKYDGYRMVCRHRARQGAPVFAQRQGMDRGTAADRALALAPRRRDRLARRRDRRRRRGGPHAIPGAAERAVRPERRADHLFRSSTSSISTDTTCAVSR